MAGLKPCIERGCYVLTKETRCSTHQQTNSGGWHRTGQAPAKRIAGRKLQQFRQALFADEPFCRACKVKVAVIRDHIVPLAEGGEDVRENTQPLCQRCSDEKTHAEAHRGRIRATE